VAAVKGQLPEICVMTDVCLCEYTDHGHCGIVEGEQVRNDPSVARLAATALSHARAGADVVAPSDMMDGRVAAIRRALDEHDFEETPIVSYAAKFASAFYGPFRDAAESTPAFGDRRSYQMDPPNRREALREMRLDLEEGADVLMVKPALPYLDVLADARREFDVPLAAYQVSGEYSMIHAAAQRGWIDGERAMNEALIAIKRAGADWILTYAAADLATTLR
jgi:porphobilinogen synthase